MSKKLSSRVLEQEWDYETGDYYNPSTKQVLKEFAFYCENMYRDLLSFEENYGKDFVINDKNNLTIEKCKEIFNSAYDTLISLTSVKEEYMKSRENDFPTPTMNIDQFWQTIGRFGILTYNQYYKKGILQIFKGDVIRGEKINDRMRITDECFPKIRKIANIIFELEEVMSHKVKELWQNSVINDISKYNKNEPFGLIIKVLYDWRHEMKTDEINKFLEKRIASSTSYVTDKKARFFSQYTRNSQIVGLVYSNDGIICAKDEDAFLEEYVDGSCPMGDKSEYSKVMRVAKFGTHDIYSTATKICPPNCSIKKYRDSFNEIIIDKRKSKPIAVFYICKSDNPYINSEVKEAYQLAQKLSIKFKLPIIGIEDKNLYLNKEHTN